MSENQYDIPNISVDVVPIIVDPVTNKLGVIVARRAYEPSQGEFALPGVLLDGPERLNEAAYRALAAKVDIGQDQVVGLFDLGTFDNPDRDPRGATVSIAKIAIINPNALAEGTHANFLPELRAIPLDTVSGFEATERLPFDHNTIIHYAAEMVSEKLMHSKEFTRALLGEQFTTKTIRVILEQLGTIIPDGDIQSDFSNLGRVLKNSGWVQPAGTPNVKSFNVETDTPGVFASVSYDSFSPANTDSYSTDSYTSSSTGRGRPSRSWTWIV